MMTMMVVCGRSRVKPKGSLFHPIPLFISHDTLLAGALVLPLSLPGFWLHGVDRIWSMVGGQSTTQVLGGEIAGPPFAPSILQLFLLTWKNIYWFHGAMVGRTVSVQ
jgi:hypothetical protein